MENKKKIKKKIKIILEINGTYFLNEKEIIFSFKKLKGGDFVIIK